MSYLFGVLKGLVFVDEALDKKQARSRVISLPTLSNRMYKGRAGALYEATTDRPLPNRSFAEESSCANKLHGERGEVREDAGQARLDY